MMDNQSFEKTRLVFLDQFHGLCRNNMYPDALALAQQRLKAWPMDADAYIAAGEAQVAMAHLAESQQMLCELEKKISALAGVFARMGEFYTKKGYAREAQLCYQQYQVYHPSAEKRQALTSQSTSFEEVQKNESNLDQQDHAASTDHLIHTLSGWLINIRRIKTHAASHQ